MAVSYQRDNRQQKEGAGARGRSATRRSNSGVLSPTGQRTKQRAAVMSEGGVKPDRKGVARNALRPKRSQPSPRRSPAMKVWASEMPECRRPNRQPEAGTRPVQSRRWSAYPERVARGKVSRQVWCWRRRHETQNRNGKHVRSYTTEYSTNRCEELVETVVSRSGVCVRWQLHR